MSLVYVLEERTRPDIIIETIRDEPSKESGAVTDGAICNALRCDEVIVILSLDFCSLYVIIIIRRNSKTKRTLLFWEHGTLQCLDATKPISKSLERGVM